MPLTDKGRISVPGFDERGVLTFGEVPGRSPPAVSREAQHLCYAAACLTQKRVGKHSEFQVVTKDF